MIDCDVLIIGSGPAGYTAALYATRAGLKTLLYTGTHVGGQLMYTHAVENFPAFDVISGPDLMDKLKKQIETLGTQIVYEKIGNLIPTEDVDPVSEYENEEYPTTGDAEDEC